MLKQPVPNYPSRTKRAVCFYCSADMLDENLEKHCETARNKPKRVKGQQLLSFALSASEPVESSRKKNKLDDSNDINADILESSAASTSDTSTEIDTNPACESEKQISVNNDIDTVGSVVQESSKKLDVIIEEIRKLHLIIPEDANVTSANKVVKESISSTENQVDEKFRGCKTADEICNAFENITLVPKENVLSCMKCVVYPTQGGAHIPGRFAYDVINDETYQSTNVTSREFRNLKTDIKRRLKNEIHLRNVWEGVTTI